jgi:hypothetical protein
MNLFDRKHIFALGFVLTCFIVPFLLTARDQPYHKEDEFPIIHLFKASTKNTHKSPHFSLINTLSDATSSPIIVESGVYVNSLGRFDYVKKNFFINFYIWFLFSDPSYHPEKSVEIANAEDFKQIFSSKDNVQGKLRIQSRYTATVSQDWNMKFYPFDRQILRISIEDNLLDYNQVRYIPLSKDSQLSPDVIFKGWKVEKFDLVHEPHLYAVNFGDKFSPESTYSRLNILFELKREGSQIFIVYFIGYFLAVILSFLTYLIPKKFFEITITISLGSIFSGIGNKYQIGETYSEMVGISLGGILTLLTFSVILITILNTIVTHSLLIHEKRNLSIGINYSVFGTTLFLYLLILISSLKVAINA